MAWIFRIHKREPIEVLEKTGGNKSKAAEFLGVSHVTVRNRMKRFNADIPRQIKIKSMIEKN